MYATRKNVVSMHVTRKKEKNKQTATGDDNKISVVFHVKILNLNS